MRPVARTGVGPLLDPVHAGRASGCTEDLLLSGSDRASLAAGLLRWLTAHVAQFDVPQEDAVVDQDPDSIEIGAERKAFVELGIALRLAVRYMPPGAEDGVKKLTDHWLGVADRRHIFFDPLRRPGLVAGQAINYMTMSELGQEPPEVHSALQRAINLHRFDRADWPAWKQQNLVWYLDGAGLRHMMPPMRDLMERSILFRPPPLPHASTADLYAITHLIFGLTDMGRRRSDGLLSEDERTSLRNYLSVALATLLLERDWDLVGEVLLSRLYLATPPDALDKHAAAALAAAQHHTGYVPGPFRDSRKASAPIQQFGDAYHTTIIALILLTACEQYASHHREAQS